MTENSRSHDTFRQRALADHESRFRRSSADAAAFLDFLKRSDVGIWRVEQDRSPSKWWINVTLPEYRANVFGLNREIQVLYTEYERVEPRALSQIQAHVTSDMRVETDVAILVSRDKQVQHTAARRKGEIAIVTIDLDEIQLPSSPLLDGLIAKSVATVDHFDVSTPIREPSGFYGRAAEIEVANKDLDRAVSVGIFGLRKAGKTSLLNSIAALRSSDDRNVTIRVDVSEILTAEQFRSRVLEQMWHAIHSLPDKASVRPHQRTLTRDGTRRVDTPDSSAHWIQDLRAMLAHVERPAVLIVDEIDQAFPPRSNLEEREAHALFAALVQLRSLLQEQETLVLLCAGVDPALFESPVIDGRDNLLYKLVRLVWLAPMNRDEIAEMVRSLGKRMGVRVRDHHVIDNLFEAYGGHPLLTRKACSLVARDRNPESLPFHIEIGALTDAMDSRELGGPRDQAADVIASFTEWFPGESALLHLRFSPSADERSLAVDLLNDDPDGLIHAVAYGVCFPDYRPRITAAIQALERER